MSNFKKKHLDYFDYIRIFASVNVIFMHVAVGGIREINNPSWILTNLVISIAYTSVPLFFMMSGYLLISSEKTTDLSVVLKKRLPKLLVPLITWTIISALWLTFYEGSYSSFSIKVFLNYLVYSLDNPIFIYLWFMYTMCSLYLVSPFISKIINTLDDKLEKYLKFIIAIILFISVIKVVVPAPWNKLFNYKILNNLDFFGGHLNSFFIGYYLAKSNKKYSNKQLFSTFSVLLIIIVFGTMYNTYSTGIYDSSYHVQSAGFEIFLAATVFLIFKQNFDYKNNLVNNVASYTYPVYMMHGLLLSFIGTLTLIPFSFFGIIFYTLLIFLICLLTNKLLSSFEFTSYIFTGIKFTDKKEISNNE